MTDKLGTFAQMLNEAPYHVRQTLGEIVLPADEGELLHKELCEGCVLVKGVSNSSVKDGSATHAWAAKGMESKVLVEGVGPADGDPETIDFFCGELVGILALVCFLWALIDFYGDPEEVVGVNIHCNNDSAVKEASKVIKGRGLRTYLSVEFDIIAEIRGVVEELQWRCMEVDFKWLKGHQDEGGDDKELTRKAMLNVDCDM